jgi:tyrosine-specific transport protein
MNSKLIGGILLVVGTSIGGGMLALPIAGAGGGFLYSSLLLLFCWMAMTFAAFLILEVNLWLPQNSNMISMAKKTLGVGGAIIAWITYLLLLYSLLSAYIAGGSDILHGLLSAMGVKSTISLDACLFVLILGFIVYKGVQSVDYVNRGLMFTKLAAFLILIILITPFIQMPDLTSGKAHLLLGSIMVMITSFGFATIVPSLRSYFQSDVAKLRRIIFIGSLIPLICYIIWDLAIMGTLPSGGKNGLIQMMQSGHSTTDLTNSLSIFLHSNAVTRITRLFTSICMATSFLGVSLGLSDFLADGFNMEKRGVNAITIYGVTFLPPLALVLYFHNAFIGGLNYAGICCVVLLMLLPALMTWQGRYRRQVAHGYQVVGGKASVILLTIVSIGMLILSVQQTVSGLIK